MFGLVSGYIPDQHDHQQPRCEAIIVENRNTEKRCFNVEKGYNGVVEKDKAEQEQSHQSPALDRFGCHCDAAPCGLALLSS